MFTFNISLVAWIVLRVLLVLLMKKLFSKPFKCFISKLFDNESNKEQKNQPIELVEELTDKKEKQSIEMKKVVHVEVCKAVNSNLKNEIVVEIATKELQEILISYRYLQLNKTISFNDFKPKTLSKKVLSPIKSYYLSTGQEDEEFLYSYNVNHYAFSWYIYQLNEEDAASETTQYDGDEISASTCWILPSSEFYLLWDNLFYNENIKNQLLCYMETAMLYSKREVNPQVITWNKVILLHGPPGTGKTSLCKALAQKITIRLCEKFTHGQLVEINSHSLFSKWFSESGKLVMNLFNKIRELLQDQKTLVCILIDEVESLAHARKACANGSEPSDSIRVVNALLTQLDSLKRHPNVLILTTSNLTEAIDVAFVDRADIKQYIPHPNAIAIYKIYFTCIKELMRTGFIEETNIFDISTLKQNFEKKYKTCESSFQLYDLAKDSVGLSGRTLRKIPFLAHALNGQTRTCSLVQFIKYMRVALQNEYKNREELVNK